MDYSSDTWKLFGMTFGGRDDFGLVKTNNKAKFGLTCLLAILVGK